MSTLVFLRNPEAGETSFLRLLNLKQVGKVEEYAFDRKLCNKVQNINHSDFWCPDDFRDSVSGHIGLYFLLVNSKLLLLLGNFGILGASVNRFVLFALVNQLVHGTFCVSNLISLKLGVGHEHYRGKHDKHHLEGPKSHVRNGRESIEAHILATGLIRIAFEVSLNDSVRFFRS